MPSEPSNFRHLFSDTPKPSIDVESVVRRSRARRTPRLLAAGAFTVLAIGGLSAVSVQGLSQLGSATSTASDSGASSEETFGLDSAAEDSTMSGSAIKRAPAEKINLCTGGVTLLDLNQTGLELTTAFPDAAAGSTSVVGTVTMTNTGTETVTGYTAATPAITLAKDGIVVWHSNGPMIDLARDVVLAPGESLVYDASFTPVVCGVEDDSAEAFRTDLPAAPAGEYQVSALIDLLGEGDAGLVTGPAQTITLQ